MTRNVGGRLLARGALWDLVGLGRGDRCLILSPGQIGHAGSERVLFAHRDYLIGWRFASSRRVLVDNTKAENNVAGYQCLLFLSNLNPPRHSRGVADSPGCQAALTNKENLSSRVAKIQEKAPSTLPPPKISPRVHVGTRNEVWHTTSIYCLNNIQSRDVLQSHLANGLLLQGRHTSRTETLEGKGVGLLDQVIDGPLHFDPGILVVS